MRSHILAASRFLVFSAGLGTVVGQATPTAIYLSGDARGSAMPKIERLILGQPQVSFDKFGGLARRIPLEAWRGKRLRLALSLKNDGAACAYVSVQINKSNLTAIRTASAINAFRDQEWKTHSFVLDVPDNAPIWCWSPVSRARAGYGWAA